MRPSDATAAMAADRSVGILIDRRGASAGRSLPTDLEFVAGIDLDGNGGVTASLVKARNGGALPPRGREIATSAHIRLLDRFYLPSVRDSAIVAPMFELAADLYDDITDQRLNRRVARRLLDNVLVDAPAQALVLDFGCGTGVAALALSDLAVTAHLVGVDLSDAMLRHAVARGMTTIGMADWRSTPPMIDGAIAAFVLHYGVSDADLGTLARSLKPGAAFAANFFGSSEEKVSSTIISLERVGLSLETREPMGRSSKPDVLLVFRRIHDA